jgi:YtkA-like
MRLIWIAAALSSSVGCSSMSSDGDDDSLQQPVDCSSVTTADTFVVDLEKQGAGGNVDFKLVSIDPAPAVRGNNTWVVQLDSMAGGVVGSPMDGATLTATPFMPAHQHGSPITPEITATGNPGEYSISPINLWMPGVWTTTIAVTVPSTDRAVYSFCVN